ncbi:MAG: hypothetical protein ABI054_13905 [Planctomycetota bacterium]
MESPIIEAPPPAAARRRRSVEERVAEYEAEIAELKAKAARKSAEASAIASKPAAARPKPRSKAPAIDPLDAELDAELRDLVDGFVASLSEVIRKALIARAGRALMGSGDDHPRVARPTKRGDR